uniref:PD-(D/E)XK nuclease domain-containing protein n=1 Tax=Caulerpa okamurae TaxID=118247 RepID=A0A3S5FWS1_9CHLO|nr:hypothetical protein [Caulerpa okamurae]
MDRTQGNIANSSGNVLEQNVISTFKTKGFEVVKYSFWNKNQNKYGGVPKGLLKNVPFESIYGHKGYTEFLLKSKKYNLEIRIECKWQQSAGSVDEKLPYLYLNCVESMLEKDIIIIIDGGGYKEGALKWIKESVRTRKYQNSNMKNIQIMNIVEFMTWANNNF